MVSTAVELDVRPLSGTIGAEIRGVDVAEPLDADTMAAVRAAASEISGYDPIPISRALPSSM